MRYVAMRKLTFTGQDGATYSVLPGEAVPGFEDWAAAIKHAHLTLHSVADTEGALQPTVGDGCIQMAIYGPTNTKQDQVASEAIGPEVPRVEPLSAHYYCPDCDHPGFVNKNSLAKHLARKHPKPS